MKNFAWLSTVPEDFSGEWSRQAVLLGMIERSGVRVVPGIALNAEVARQFFQQRQLRSKVASLFADALATPTGGLRHVSASLRETVRTFPLGEKSAQQLRESAVSLAHGTDLQGGITDRYRIHWDGHSLVRDGSIGDVVRSVYASQFNPGRIRSQVLGQDLRITAYPLFVQLVPQVRLSGTLSTDRSSAGDQTVLSVVVENQEMYRINMKDGFLLSEHPESEVSLDTATQEALVRVAKKVYGALGELPILRWILTPHGVQIQEVKEECTPVQTVRHVGEVSGTVRIFKDALSAQTFSKNDIVLIDSVQINDVTRLNTAGGLLVVSTLPPDVHVDVPVISQLPSRCVHQLQQGSFVHVDATRRFINGVSVGDSRAVRILTTISHMAEHPRMSNSDGLMLTRSHSLLELLGVRAERHRHEYGAVLADELLRLARLAAPESFYYQLHDIQGEGTSHFDAITGGSAGTRALLRAGPWVATEAAAIAEAYRKGAHNLIPVLPIIHSLADYELVKDVLMQAAPHSHLWNSLWLTVATPAIAINADELVTASPQGIVIDLSTLAQLTTGTDSSSRTVGHLHRDDHPAVVKMVTYLLAVCRQAGVPTIIMTGDNYLSEATVRYAIEQGSRYVAVPAGTEKRSLQRIKAFEHSQELQYWLDA